MWDGIERRHMNFNPETPFEAYIYAKLESMTQRLDTLPCSESSKRINAVEQKVANIEGKAGILGAVTGFVAGIFSKMFFGK